MLSSHFLGETGHGNDFRPQSRFERSLAIKRHFVHEKNEPSFSAGTTMAQCQFCATAAAAIQLPVSWTPEGRGTSERYRHKPWDISRLRSKDLSSTHSWKKRCSGLVPSTTSGTKQSPKPAILCHAISPPDQHNSSSGKWSRQQNRGGHGQGLGAGRSLIAP
jgi:hypothetical protein